MFIVIGGMFAGIIWASGTYALFGLDAAAVVFCIAAPITSGIMTTFRASGRYDTITQLQAENLMLRDVAERAGAALDELRATHIRYREAVEARERQREELRLLRSGRPLRVINGGMNGAGELPE